MIATLYVSGIILPVLRGDDYAAKLCPTFILEGGHTRSTGFDVYVSLCAWSLQKSNVSDVQSTRLCVMPISYWIQ